CDSVTVVNPAERLTGLAEQAGWEIVRPERPWKSRRGFGIRALALLFGWGEDPGKLKS
ncbi:MAG: hypothetical protein RLZZ214_2936, partial [Verrucomicrobiota bacterium]